jgi:hypothetical protein
MRVSPDTQPHTGERLELLDFNMTLRTVVLYGNSLVVSSIGASLQGRAELQVSSVDTTCPQAEERLRALQPDVVIFDLAAARPEFAIALWKTQPHLLLIGVDLLAHEALMLSGQPSRLLTLDDLLGAIKNEEHQHD